MTGIVPHLASFSAKVALLGGLAWLQLHLLRRAPAASRSRLCSVALAAILLLAAGEMLAPDWMVKGTVFHFTAAATRTVTATDASFPVGSILTLLWLAGAGFMLLRAAVGRIGLMTIRGRSTSFAEIDGVDVRLSPVQTPILCGWRRPSVLLPETARTWTDDQRRMVLTHELTHFRQGDMWTNALAQILRSVFWFHPVVWLLVSRLSREQELTCDEAVVASGHSRHDYAAFLLKTVRNLKSGEIFACAMAGSGARSLKRRFANLLDPLPRPLLTRRSAALLASFALAATMLTVVRPAWSQGEVYRVGGDVTPPKVLNLVHPDYTEDAKAARIEGTVLLQCVVTADGNADNIKVVKGINPGLDERAMEALAKWTFQPGTKDGKAVAVWATIEVNFRLK